MKISSTQQKEIFEKKNNLKLISETLKKEFFGIDNIIDEVLQSIESWYLFPNYQTRPLIVNLWGMTGTGKTSLVRRLVELLNKKEEYMHLDLGEQADGSNWLARNKFDTAIGRIHEKEAIICLDEFQLCRTTTDDGDEIDRSAIRVIWEMIDTGIVNTGEIYAHHIYDIFILKKILKKCIQHEVVVQNGRVVEGKEIYASIYNHSLDYHSGRCVTIGNEDHPLFLPPEYKIELYDLYQDVYPDYEVFENYLLSLDGNGTLTLLDKAIDKGNSLKIINLSKTLIFVVGNLDEVFVMYDDINPDVDPDIFYQYTTKISSTDIKKGLKKRFRSEQIARLGNNHIIYPALSRDAYHKLIQSELDKLSMQFEQMTNSRLIFDTSVNDLIFNEGVFPTQGARPVFTSVQLQLDSNFGRVINHAILNHPTSNEIHWSFAESNHIIKFCEDGTELGTYKFKTELKVESLRKSKNDDKQAVIAVHEAGHAVTMALSSRCLPSKIVSASPMGDIGGSTFANWQEDMINKNNIKHRIMISLGGYLAEKLIFGDANITLGSESDLEYASVLSNSAIKKYGMGSIARSTDIIHYTTSKLFHSDQLVNEEAQNFFELCLNEAKSILSRNRKLIVEMAKYLTNNSSMSREKIEVFIKEFAVDEWVRSEGFQTSVCYNYREKLFGME